MQTFWGILIPFLGTALGAACVFFMKKALSDAVQRSLTGFAAGVMVAASVWSLLIPAVEQSAGMGKLSFLPAFLGFWLGILFLLALDHIIPHLHANSAQAEGPKSRLQRTTMMVLAVTLHNIPEGMAVGVVYAGYRSGSAQVTAAGALALSLGIAIQNFPEGAIISMPLRAEGMKKGRAFCGCCGHALSRTMQKTSYYHCRHSEADVESRCHKMRLNAAELEQAVFLTLKKQMEAAAPLAPDGTLRVDASVPERTEYEQQIEALQDGKRALYERYLMGEIDLNTYKAEKAACDELLLKTKNAYAAVLAQAKQKQDEQARQDSRKEASKAIFDADTLTTALAELLIDRVLVYPDKRMEIAYKIRDIFD